LLKSAATPAFEATSLEPDAVTDRSHIANEVPEDIDS
jgi:hypothetical protein